MLTAPDFRAEFGSELMFVPLSRYVDGTDYAWEYFSLSDNQTRIISDLEMPLTGLMFHELAHANDFFRRIGSTAWIPLCQFGMQRIPLRGSGFHREYMLRNH